ncbi:Beta-galactosidase/beta-glucuronidase [Geosmithia morbida]|uniref:Beta-galactosidase/beta-glucuronidase n=1 Tax=Geosmithia morbida TaxID=1094350 RepID=A0A9P4YUG0_9HYPO|nr:Beta-galactosidase/beta-glucuronidase [Geosmithia morbida]KAF4122757.1 Beta-galactosidase/beta-glucuronidase [Geosmithia morbida]
MTPTLAGTSPPSPGTRPCETWYAYDIMLPSAAPALAGVLLLGTVVSAQVPYEVKKPPLDTDWTYSVGTDPWPEYPRPQMVREAWQSLNGLWTWRSASGDDEINTPPSGPLDYEVLVPSCIESGLSGLQVLDTRHMWYETTFEVPGDWEGQSVLLNFEAVDYRATVIINGNVKETHVGGYNRFAIDVTEDVSVGGQNTLLVFVHDPTDDEIVPVGKQTNNPSHIFYRPCSGIWQQVWIEAVPRDYIDRLDISATFDGEVTVNVVSSGQNSADVKVEIYDQDGSEIGSSEGTADEPFNFTVQGVREWWPDSPTLYNVTVTMGDDEVTSYTGFRTVSKGKVEGITRYLLNDEFVFQFGTLDQGYWPDGLYTPPNYEAMVWDLKLLKDLGFNMVRKHIKVEPDLFYRACDELGLMVIQDMPSLPPSSQPNAEEQAEFQRQLEIMIDQHKSFPSICTWVIYNEGWGQLTTLPAPEELLTQVVRDHDPSRLIDSVTGWRDHGFGDYHDNHKYASPQCGTPFWSRLNTPYDAERIGFQGEYGGIGHNVSIDHLWNVQAAIDSIPETYEMNEDLDSYNYRSSTLFRDIREQTERYACSGAVYTQTTDVEGEVNGLVTYDRRILRPYEAQWKEDIQSLYDAAESRGGRAYGDYRA